uniref:Uncharacterized protein n=1 Tax=Triticum urartu TaxID=4572 RepID=A0A8R7P062_TRIUA
MATYIQSLLHAQLYISQGKQRLMEQPWHLLHLVHEYFRPANLPKSTDPQQMPKRPVTAYCIFMSQVACTVEDVRLLVDAKIVQHFEGSDEHAAQGFADLCKGVVMDVDNIDRNYLKPIWHDLEKRHKSRAHNFWGGHSQRVAIALALLVVVVLLACVVTQTFYVIIG